MNNKIRFAAFILAALLFSTAMSGCITRRYTDDSGQQCQKKYKFFILFFKISSSCEPAQDADSQQASIQTNTQP